jgi:hypothetical protein
MSFNSQRSSKESLEASEEEVGIGHSRERNALISRWERVFCSLTLFMNFSPYLKSCDSDCVYSVGTSKDNAWSTGNMSSISRRNFSKRSGASGRCATASIESDSLAMSLPARESKNPTGEMGNQFMTHEMSQSDVSSSIAVRSRNHRGNSRLTIRIQPVPDHTNSTK